MSIIFIHSVSIVITSNKTIRSKRACVCTAAKWGVARSDLRLHCTVATKVGERKALSDKVGVSSYRKMKRTLSL